MNFTNTEITTVTNVVTFNFTAEEFKIFRYMMSCDITVSNAIYGPGVCNNRREILANIMNQFYQNT